MNSINRKLTRLVGISVGSACLLMGGLGCWQELSRYAAAKQQELQSASSAFGAATSGALARHDRSSAQQALRGIASLPGYRYASVRGPDGIILAEVGSGARLARDLTMVDQDSGLSPWSLFLTGTVAIDDAVFDDGQLVGRLQLISDASDIRSRLMADGSSALIGSLAALMLSLLISQKMQRTLTNPLLRLTGVMTEVRRTHRYDAKVDVVSDDEIGVLAQTFRAMLDEVRERDARLLGHQQRLEADVADRTRELVIAKTEADKANAAKSDFLATMSHEIRTPMNGVMVMADLLAKADLPTRQRRYAQVIAQSGHGLLAIINDILDLSKIEAGKLTIESTPFDPVDVVDRIVTLQASRSEERGLELVCSCAPGVPREIIGDPTRFGQIVNNLVGNALKFTTEGNVQVRLDVSGRDLELSVADTGIGIAPDKLEKIFEPFAQADQSTARRFGGTGLGLSISRRLADAMGASISARSVEGQGSTFRLVFAGVAGSTPVAMPELSHSIFLDIGQHATRGALAEQLTARGYTIVGDVAKATHAICDAHRLREAALNPVPGKLVALASSVGLPDDHPDLRPDYILTKPVTQADLAEVMTLFAGRATLGRSTVRLTSASALPQWKGLRVLVVDDSDLNLEVAVAALAQFGIAADTCLSGAEAINKIFAKRYDLVLMDGSMPELDGYETTRRVRDRENAEGINRTRIVALTAHVVGAISEAWSQCGMDGVLHKPITMEALASTLKGAGESRAEHVEGGEEVERVGELEEGAEALLDAGTIENLHEMGQRSTGSFLSRIIGLFVAECPVALEAIRLAAAQGNSEQAAKTAHKLKSMSLNMGARRLAAQLQALETDARDRGGLPSDSALARLSITMDDTVSQLHVALPDPSSRREIPSLNAIENIA